MLLVRLLLNEVVGVNTGSRVPRLVFPVLFRSSFGRMALANALAIPPDCGRSRPATGTPRT